MTAYLRSVFQAEGFVSARTASTVVEVDMISERLIRGMQSLLLEVSRAENNTILFVTHDVSEAVYLGDTIYVLSPRPAQILHQVDVPAFPVRDIALKSASEFRAIEKKLLDLIYAPAKN